MVGASLMEVEGSGATTTPLRIRHIGPLPSQVIRREKRANQLEEIKELESDKHQSNYKQHI